MFHCKVEIKQPEFLDLCIYRVSQTTRQNYIFKTRLQLEKNVVNQNGFKCFTFLYYFHAFLCINAVIKCNCAFFKNKTSYFRYTN